MMGSTSTQINSSPSRGFQPASPGPRDLWHGGRGKGQKKGEQRCLKQETQTSPSNPNRLST